MNQRYFLLISALFILLNGFSQNKYALLIGINQYQKLNKKGKPIVDPVNSKLTGCVNDAEAIKEVLINDFSFKQENIKTLYDFKATKINILKEIDALRARCKKGDVAVVYYAGHGMPFRYDKDSNQVAEVILPSNAFITAPFSYIQSTELAKKFNLFVDNDITLTTIFDCCFGFGTISKGGVNEPVMHPRDSILNSERSESFLDSLLLSMDGSEDDFVVEGDEKDLLDGEDNVAEEITEQQEVMPSRGLTLAQYREMTKHVKPFGFEDVDTTFNPPSQRKGSKFIFLSSTTDKQEAPEMKDENGQSHGAFTNAFIKVVKTNPITISFKELFKKVAQQLKQFGKSITPSARYKLYQREDQNIFGVETGKTKLKVYLPSASAAFRDLNSIYKNMIMPLLKDKPNNLAVNQQNALCSKVYIQHTGMNYYYYYIDGKTKKEMNIFHMDTLKKYLKQQYYILYLPVPKEISNPIKSKLKANSNIVFVDNPEKADVSIFCTNYTKVKKDAAGNILDIGKDINGRMSTDDYRKKLSFAVSYETVGVKRKMPGHYYTPYEPLVSASENAEIIIKLFEDWFNMKSKK